MRVRTILLLLSISTIAYLLFWPTGLVFPKTDLPAVAKYQLGDNQGLSQIKPLATSGEGPVSVTSNKNGTLFTGIANGNLFKLSPNAKNWQAITLTYGRPMGLAMSSDDKWIYIADADRGIMRTDTSGHLELLVNSEKFDKGFAFDVVAANQDTIYFTVSNTEWPYTKIYDALLVNNPTGKVYRYVNSSKSLELIVDHLNFPTSLSLAKKLNKLYIAEAGSFRILEISLNDKSEWIKTFSDNLPGYPIGMDFDQENKLWLSLSDNRNKTVDKLAANPFWREVVYRIPWTYKPKPNGRSILIKLNPDGEIVKNYSGNELKHDFICDLNWLGDHLYLGSLWNNTVGTLDAQVLD